MELQNSILLTRIYEGVISIRLIHQDKFNACIRSEYEIWTYSWTDLALSGLGSAIALIRERDRPVLLEFKVWSRFDWSGSPTNNSCFAHEIDTSELLKTWIELNWFRKSLDRNYNVGQQLDLDEGGRLWGYGEGGYRKLQLIQMDMGQGSPPNLAAEPGGLEYPPISYFTVDLENLSRFCVYSNPCPWFPWVNLLVHIKK